MVREARYNSMPPVEMKARPRVRPRGSGAGVWRQVVDGLTTPIAVVDADGVFVAANRAFRSRMHEAAVSGHVSAGGREPDLATAVQLVVAAADQTSYCALSSSGLVFDCRRLDDARELVALVGQGR